MFNWAFHFLYDNQSLFINIGFIFSICNLVVSTFFDIAFHGNFRIYIPYRGHEMHGGSGDNYGVGYDTITRGIRRRGR